MADANAAPRSRFSMAAGAAGVLFCCLPFYVTVVPPMADLPAHVLVARILLNYGDSALRYSDYFDIQWAVAPTSLFYVLLVQLQKLSGPILDARIYLTIWVAGIWLSVWYLARVLRERDPWTAALVALPLSFCGYAYQGFLPFLMSLPLFALTIAVWFNDWQPTAKIASLWLLLAALFGFHIVGAAAAGAVIGVAALTQAFDRQDRRKKLALACLALAPLVVMTGFYLLGQQAPSATIGYSGVLSQVYDVIKFTIATLNDWVAVLMLAWIAALGLIFAWRWRPWISSLPVLLGVALLGVLSVAMPGSLGALWPAGPRLLPFALLLVIAGMQWPERHRRLVSIACLLLVTGMSVLTTRHALQIDRGYWDVLGAAQHVDAGKRVLPVVDRSNGPRWISPYLHAGDWITVERGGMNPYVLATPYIRTGASPLVFRRESDSRQFARLIGDVREPEFYRGVAGFYDYVMLFGSSPAMADVAGVIGQEMKIVYQQNSVRLFARTGRPPGN